MYGPSAVAALGYGMARTVALAGSSVSGDAGRAHIAVRRETHDPSEEGGGRCNRSDPQDGPFPVSWWMLLMSVCTACLLSARQDGFEVVGRGCGTALMVESSCGAGGNFRTCLLEHLVQGVGEA